MAGYILEICFITREWTSFFGSHTLQMEKAEKEKNYQNLCNLSKEILSYLHPYMCERDVNPSINLNW